MPSNTPNLDLTVYSPSDTETKFLDYRTKTNGNTGSNMTKIDAFAGQVKTDISELRQVKGILYIPATKINDNQYVATIEGFPGYSDDMIISVQLDIENAGSIVLNINNLGNTSLMKKDSVGTSINMAQGDLLAYKEYLFRYENTSWVILGAVPSDQVSVSGNNGEVLYIQNGSIVASGKQLGISNGIATTNENNKVVQTALKADESTNSQTSDIATTVIDNAITDAKIGNRTVDDSLVPTNNVNMLNPLLNNLANRIKTITGETDWKSTSSTSLFDLLGKFNISTGHSHNGADSKKIDYGSIINNPYIPQVIDSLSSTSTQDTLSANQGRVLNEQDANLSQIKLDKIEQKKEQSLEQKLEERRYRFYNPTSGFPEGYTSDSDFILEVMPVADGVKDFQRHMLYDVRNDYLFTRKVFNDIIGDWKKLATTEKIDISFPYNSGWGDIDTLYGMSNITRTDTIVTVSINTKKASSIDLKDVIATLPVGFRPKKSIVVGGASPEGTNIGYITIYPNGNVLAIPTNIGSQIAIYGTLTYVIGS